MRMRELLLLLLCCSGGCSPVPAPTSHPQMAKVSVVIMKNLLFSMHLKELGSIGLQLLVIMVETQIFMDGTHTHTETEF